MIIKGDFVDGGSEGAWRRQGDFGARRRQGDFVDRVWSSEEVVNMIGSSFFYLYCPISLLHARVSQVLLNICMRVWGGIGSGVCFSLFMVSACYWRGRLCFGRGRDKGFVLYITLFLRVLGWGVCVCLYMRVYTNKLLGYLRWAQVRDGHLESRKNPDRLKRSMHVDRTGVHSTFVYIYAGLRVLMIWANCLFLLTCLFFLEK